MMRTTRLYGVRDLRLDTIQQPVPKDDELLIRVRSVGVCGSDLHYYLEGGIGSDVVIEPFTLGHEFAGELIDERAEQFGLRQGQLVAVDPARPCLHCEWCEEGYHNLCPNVKFTGSPPNQGALAEYFTAPRQVIFPVPERFDADEAALLEPLGVAIHAVDLAKLKPGSSVGIIGAGPIGLLIQQVAMHSGALETFVIDPLLYRTEVAQKLGATAVATSHQAILDWTKGRGVDVVIEATNSPSGPQHAAEAVRIGGKLILVGIPEGDSFSLTASIIRRKGLTIKLSRRMNHVYPRAIKMVQRGLVDVKAVVSHTFKLEDTPRAYQLHADYADKVLKSMIHL
jgi:L-iditol 2-dehydrogenase